MAHNLVPRVSPMTVVKRRDPGNESLPTEQVLWGECEVLVMHSRDVAKISNRWDYVDGRWVLFTLR